MATVTLRDVSKVFDGKVVAVNKFNLEINDREFIVFVGPSGCGKTTTLRMVSGLEEITAGEIAIDNVIVNDIPPKDREIAMVFQNYALYPHMSVYKNLAFGLKLRKYPKEEIDKRVKEAADILEIHDLLGRKPKELSGGQMQRVALGRAIVRNAKVYLLDEPLSNLDAKLRVEMRAELNRLHTRLQATMIYVTHDQVEAMTLGDRIVIMLDGLIQQVDTPINIYDYPVNKFVGSFIGSPPMNFINGTVIKDNGDLAFLFTDGQNKIRIPERIHKKVDSYIDKEVYLGVRPEASSMPITMPCQRKGDPIMIG
jgi:multiple sugar transport system ATP-binding protein